MNSCVRRFSTKARSHFMRSLEQQASLPPHPRIGTLPSTMAVFVPLLYDGEGGRVLLTKRSSLLRAHRGEVCFPGGKRDEGETLEQTALRETHEEIGVPCEHVDVWGHLRPVITRQVTSTVTPVVGLIREPAVLQGLYVNEEEVQIVLSVSVDELCSRVQYTEFKDRKLHYKLPVFHAKDYNVHFSSASAYLPSEFRIWGLSAVMLHQALTSIAPQYSPNLKVAFY